MTSVRSLCALVAVALAMGLATPAPASTDAEDRNRLIEDLIAVAQLDETDASTPMRLAHMLRDAGRHDEAAHWIDVAIKRNDELAIDILAPDPDLDRGAMPISSGPDVIVGDITRLYRWGKQGDITAYSIGTTSCNAGDENLKWEAQTKFHPVIAQHAYRIKDGRIEMIGQSFVKHGFAALTGSLCQTEFGYGCSGQGGTVLGVGCSDPYSSNLNGSYSWLGRKLEINATTGEFPFPPTRVASGAPIGQRLQIRDEYLDPALNQDATYFVEALYIASDDAAAGNAENNASHRRVTVRENAPTTQAWIIDLTDEPTVRTQPALFAWQAQNPDVLLSEGHDPDGGYFIVGSAAYANGDGTWRYEYAVYNMTSDRSGRSFTVMHGEGTHIDDLDFHDVDWHTFSPVDGTDWTTRSRPRSTEWKTDSFDDNEFANALRWGTLYNFSFTANRAPDLGYAQLGLFKPGQGSGVRFVVISPGDGLPSCPWDLDHDGFVNSKDIAALLSNHDRPFSADRIGDLLSAWGRCSRPE